MILGKPLIKVYKTITFDFKAVSGSIVLDIPDWLYWLKDKWIRFTYMIPKIYLHQKLDCRKGLYKIVKGKLVHADRIVNTNNFNSFFDTSLGRRITSRSEIKELEKQGMVMMNKNESEKYFKQYKQRNEAEAKARNREELRKSVYQMFK